MKENLVIAICASPILTLRSCDVYTWLVLADKLYNSRKNLDNLSAYRGLW